MAKLLIDDIKARYELVSKMAKQAEEKLESFPNGRIKIKHNGDHTYYYFVEEGENYKEKLLSGNDKKLIEDLIQKRYIKKVLNASKNEKEYLKKTLDNYPHPTAEGVYEQLNMDDPEYTENRVVKRINDYSLAGIDLGDKLFITMESSTTPLDVRVLDELINKQFK